MSNYIKRDGQNLQLDWVKALVYLSTEFRELLLEFTFRYLCFQLLVSFFFFVFFDAYPFFHFFLSLSTYLNLAYAIHDSKDKKWKHEMASEMMFDYLVRDNNILIPEKDQRFIKALIAGEPSRT